MSLVVVAWGETPSPSEHWLPLFEGGCGSNTIPPWKGCGDYRTPCEGQHLVNRRGQCTAWLFISVWIEAIFRPHTSVEWAQCQNSKAWVQVPPVT